MKSTNHLSVRVAWHADGWNGHVCKEPAKNIYCTGSSSFPGGMSEQVSERQLEEKKYAGCNCKAIQEKHIPPCCTSINAFGKETIMAKANAPHWFPQKETLLWEMPANTIGVWPYEEMYKDEIRDENGKYSNEKRLIEAKSYFSQFEENNSLIFYYCNYSNPFSEDDAKRYVIAGIGRLKKLGDFLYYEKVTVEERKALGGAFAWFKNVTSNYPEEGFRIPYHQYKDQPDILEKIAIFPDNERCFKYATRKMTDDDALEIIERALEVVDFLEFELLDKSENWAERRTWLQGLIGELWLNRGRYPGMERVLNHLGLPEFNPWFKTQTAAGQEEEAYQFIKQALLEGKKPSHIEISRLKWDETQDVLASVEQEKIDLLFDILPRFDLAKEQIDQILNDERSANNLNATIKEIVLNPYILSESYMGNNPDDKITFSKIDHGMLPSPDLGLEAITSKGSAIRFRALCIDQLKRVQSHTFCLADWILERVNRYVKNLSEWRQFEFRMPNFDRFADTLDGALVRRKDGQENLYLYLKDVYEDERLIETHIREMSKRRITSFTSPVTERNWKDFLYVSDSKLARLAPKEYEEAVQGQVEVCQKIFPLGLSVISGGAGTGKTTVIKSVIQAIEKAHGAGTSFLLLAPTGKATDRLRERTGKPAKTIHSFLAERGWLNNNFTFKRTGGKTEESVRIFIIDECSMLDQAMVATLFRAINWNTVQRIILVGDPNQLPAIGLGKVFSDVINWLEDEHKGILIENLRQKENEVEGRGTGILQLANLFVQERDLSAEGSAIAERKAETVDLIKRVQELDFEQDLQDINVVFWQDEKDLNDLMFSTLVKDLEHDHNLKFDEAKYYELLSKAFEHPTDAKRKKADKFQVISPYRSELFGTDALNLFLQSKFNKRNVENQQFIDGIALFDKVIQVRNRPKSNMIFAWSPGTGNVQIQIFNGELGFSSPPRYDYKKFYDKIEKRWYHYPWLSPNFRPQKMVVDFEGRSESVAFGKDLGTYLNAKGKVWRMPDEKPIDNLELAYAISVHKSQGSEFDRVFLVLPKHKKALLSRELIYTAITRAKSKLTIFAESDIGAFLQLMRPEACNLSKINSSLFDFKPLPQEWLAMNGWYEEGKIHETLSEYMVRSKSEVIIANMLAERKIPFKYESRLPAPDGTFYLPDFTVTIQGEDYYLEHLGRLDLPDYRAHWEKKEKWYNKHFPGKLLTTKEGKSLSNDVDQLIIALLSNNQP
jgi:exodeoxyribonuclease V alpha subunit